jgi:hypothetical protein
MRDCNPSAHNVSSWSVASTTIRLGSALTAVAPAAWRTSRSGGPGSTGAASGAQDWSGRRSLPSTPAPAILVVLVIGAPSAGEAGGPSSRPPQPVARVSVTAAIPAIAPSEIGTGRR